MVIRLRHEDVAMIEGCGLVDPYFVRCAHLAAATALIGDPPSTMPGIVGP